jgi:hypothetical protein
MRRAWLVLALLCCAGAAHAEDDPARRAFDEGVALEKRGDYVHALDKFMESARIKSTLGNRFHLAFCLEMTGKLASAWNEYEALDRAAHEENKPDVVAATRQRTDALRSRVPEISLRAVPALPTGGEVLVDGTVVVAHGVESKPWKLDPGEHVITAHAPDHKSYRRAITIEPSARESVDVPFEAAAAAPAPEAPAPRTRTLPFALAGGAILAAAGGTVALLAAGSAADDAHATCPTRISCDDERAEVRALDAVALGAFVSAAALAAFSIVLFRSTPGAHGFSTRGAVF